MTHHHGYRQTVGQRPPNRRDGEGVINLISIFIHLFVICYSMEHVMFIIIVEERWGGCYQFDTNLHPSFWDMLQFETCNVTVYMRDWGWRYLETEYRLFPPVTKFLDLFPHAGYFFNAFD